MTFRDTPDLSKSFTVLAEVPSQVCHKTERSYVAKLIEDKFDLVNIKELHFSDKIAGVLKLSISFSVGATSYFSLYLLMFILSKKDRCRFISVFFVGFWCRTKNKYSEID